MFTSRVRQLVVALIFVGFAAVVVAVVRGVDGGKGDDLKPVATVDGTPITKARFTKSYLERLLATGRNDTPAERYAHLDNLIQIRLLSDEARRRGLGQDDAFEAYVERNRLMAAGAAYFEEEFARTLPELTETEVRAAYRKSTEQVVLRHLFFNSREKAELAIDLLEEGEDFVDLANEVFDTPAYDSSAGMLGVASYWDLDDAVAEVAFDLAPNEISQPVRSRYGWHVLRLEDRLVNPILTESDYQTRREGIEGRARIRRNRLEGDRWVRSFMEGLDVQVDPEAARMLVDALEVVLADDDDSEIPKVRITREEVEGLRRDLEPETVLARYTLDGEALTFTAGDFVGWIPDLPYEEVRDRPMAAVGRALRNQALGLKGIREGHVDDGSAAEAVRYAADRYLADSLKARLRRQADAVPTEDEIETAFVMLGAGSIREARATYWTIPFPSFAPADAALEAVRGGREPSSFEGYERFDDRDILRIDMSGHLRRAPLGTPVVMCQADGTCSVMEVEDRTIVRNTLDEKRDEIRDLLSRILPEERLTDSLHGVKPVEVDTTLFRRMMELR